MLFKLTKSEKDILKYSWFSNKELAEKLYLSIATIKVHKNNIYQKMGVQGGNAHTKALILALKQGIITLDDLKDGGEDD